MHTGGDLRSSRSPAILRIARADHRTYRASRAARIAVTLLLPTRLNAWMRVVVTGGAGFIGSNLVHYWSREHPSDELIVIDKLTYAGNRRSIESLEREGRLRFEHADICDEEAMERILPGTDLVLNLAADTHVDRSIGDPAPFVQTNVVGTLVLLEAARRHRIGRFHQVSTDEVFGALALDRSAERFTPESPYRPRNPYAASKAAADHLVMAYQHTYGVPATISNCGNNFGPYQHPEKLIPRAIVRLLSGHKIPLYGAGANVRDWIYVEDHCEALDVIAHRGEPGRTYVVGADGEHTNLEIVTAIASRLGRDASAIEHVPDRPGHDLRYALDSHRIRSELGWRSRMTFDDGLDKTVQWYVANRRWWEPILASSGIVSGASGAAGI